jgi:hypothetical protein
MYWQIATFMNDFPQAVNDIASAIDMMMKNTSSSTTCLISEVNSGRHQSRQVRRGSYRGRGGQRDDHGRGHGRGFGGHNGHGGHGGRNNRQNNDNASESITRSYSTEVQLREA